MEYWKTITINNVAWNYEVSSMGQLRNKRTQKVRNVPMLTKYPKVKLRCHKDTETIDLHRLIAMALVPNDDPIVKTDVIHLDRNTHNNSVSNLKWVSRPEFIQFLASVDKRIVSMVTKDVLEHMATGRRTIGVISEEYDEGGILEPVPVLVSVGDEVVDTPDTTCGDGTTKCLVKPLTIVMRQHEKSINTLQLKHKIEYDTLQLQHRADYEMLQFNYDTLVQKVDDLTRQIQEIRQQIN